MRFAFPDLMCVYRILALNGTLEELFGAFQVALVLKNPPVNAGDTSLIPWRRK